MEVGGWEQAVRVVGMVFEGGGGGVGRYEVEVWRDEPAVVGGEGERVEVAGREVVVRGVGRGRAVYLRLRED